MEEENTFHGYIKEKIGAELYCILSIEEIQADWNISVKDLFFCLSSLNEFQVKLHPDHNWHIIIIDKIKAQAIKEKKKDKVSYQ